MQDDLLPHESSVDKAYQALPSEQLSETTNALILNAAKEKAALLQAKKAVKENRRFQRFAFPLATACSLLVVVFIAMQPEVMLDNIHKESLFDSVKPDVAVLSMKPASKELKKAKAKKPKPKPQSKPKVAAAPRALYEEQERHPAKESLGDHRKEKAKKHLAVLKTLQADAAYRDQKKEVSADRGLLYKHEESSISAGSMQAEGVDSFLATSVSSGIERMSLQKYEAFDSKHVWIFERYLEPALTPIACSESSKACFAFDIELFEISPENPERTQRVFFKIFKN